MIISTGTGSNEALRVHCPVKTTNIEALADANAIRTAVTADAPALQSAVLQPALAAMRDMPDFDHAKVAALRDALSKGDIPFDPARLAGLIQRFHGSDK